MKSNRPILITGSHRSATTFTANILSNVKSLGYINEPFNFDSGMQGVDVWFKYVSPDSECDEIVDPLIHDLLAGRATFKRTPFIKNRGLFNNLAKALLKSRSNYLYKAAIYNPFKDRLLIKDPIACMSSLYLHKKFNFDVVVLLRHPGSFCASIKRLGWRFDFENFYSQNSLMQDYLNNVIGDINVKRLSIIEEAAILWNCIYAVLFDYIKMCDRLIVKKHEDIAFNPAKEFEDLFLKLGLVFTDEIKSIVTSLTNSDNVVLPKNNEPHEFRRASKEVVDIWKTLLTEAEIESIYEITSPIASLMYDEDTWYKSNI